MNGKIQAGEDPRRYKLPDGERERLRRDEMTALVYFLSTLAETGYMWENLQKRLEYIPSGKARFKMVMGGHNAIVGDILGTVPREQQKRLENIGKDFKIALIPKAQNEPQKLVMDRDDARVFIGAALKKCEFCVMSGEEARTGCELYALMEKYFPLSDYGDGMMCQYGKSDFE